MKWTKPFRKFNQRNTERHQLRKAEYSKVAERLKNIRGKPFWIDDHIKHEQMWSYAPNQCCFNHIIGLPEKDGKEKPIFDYEWEIYLDLQRGEVDDRYKHLWIKKARGLGITEFFLRYMAWLALRDDQYQGKRFVVIPGTRAKIAWDLIARMKHLVREYIVEDSRLDMLILNGVIIEAFPSNPESLRGYADYKFILLDEADYFEPANQEELLPAVRGFIAKTNPYIVMVSTAHETNSLFHRIEQMKSDEEAGFIRRQYLYERGVNKIYEPHFIEEEKKQPYFKREYEGQYAYGVGNLFSEDSIARCERLGREIDAQLSTDTYRHITRATRKSLGIDIGYGSSRTAFVLTEFINGRIRVIYAAQFDRPDVNDVVRAAYNLIREHELDNGTNKVYVDGSAPEFIKSLKSICLEETDYLRLVALAKESDSEVHHLMNIVPINFGQKNQEMLDRAKKIVDNGMLAINPDMSQGHKDLLTDLRIAKNKPETLKLDKAGENKMDLFDALRLALEYYK